MSVIRNTSSAIQRGRVGNVSYFVQNGQQIVRVARNDSNYGETASRSVAQQSNRVRWSNLVNFYKLSSRWMHKAFESKKRNQSDYNRFMQVNKPSARVALTKEAALNGAVVIDNFVVSQGSLPSIVVEVVGQSYVTNIRLGSLSIDDNTTVAEFTNAVLAANAWLAEGMQISFISYQQSINIFGFPVSTCGMYEVTLERTSTAKLRSYLPVFCSTRSADGFLGTDNTISNGGFCYVLSTSVGGKTLVSSQSLIVKGEELIREFSSERAVEAAIASYGVNSEQFLDSGSNPQEPLPAALYIDSFRDATADKVYNRFGGTIKGSDINGHTLEVIFSRPVEAGVTISAIRLVPVSGPTASIEGTLSTARDKFVVTEVNLRTTDTFRAVQVPTSLLTLEYIFDPS